MRNSGLGLVLTWILILQLVFLAAGAYYGGILLMADPTGGTLQMSLSYLSNGPFTDYFWPGLILFLFIAIIPTLASIGLVLSLLKRSRRRFIYADKHWGWTLALISGLSLIIWMDTQIIVVGYSHSIQAIFMVLGALITLNALLPSVMGRHRLA